MEYKTLKKRLISFLSSLILASGANAQAINNKVLEQTFPAGTKVRTGVPADSPDKLLELFNVYFSQHQNIKTARLGLVEFVPPETQSIFCYVIGVDTASDEERALKDLKEIALASPMGRWPVMILSLKSDGHLFTNQALYIYQR